MLSTWPRSMEPICSPLVRAGSKNHWSFPRFFIIFFPSFSRLRAPIKALDLWINVWVWYNNFFAEKIIIVHPAWIRHRRNSCGKKKYEDCKKWPQTEEEEATCSSRGIFGILVSKHARTRVFMINMFVACWHWNKFQGWWKWSAAAAALASRRTFFQLFYYLSYFSPASIHQRG